MNDIPFVDGSEVFSPKGRFAGANWRKQARDPLAVEVEAAVADAEAPSAPVAAPSEDPVRVVGELPSFAARIAAQGDRVVVYRIDLDPAAIWDEDFATVMAATIDVDDRDAVREAWLGIGEATALAYEHRMLAPWPLHLATGWRFAERPCEPFLQIRLVVGPGEAPIHIQASRLFAGHDYDPNMFNPRYVALALGEGGSPVRPASDIVAWFEAAARLACRSAAYFGEQAFIRPCVVMRLGELRFPLLLGTVNGLLWYGQVPEHGLDSYSDLGYVVAGDVVFDCGANCGETVAYFALAAGPSGRVVAFDPFVQNCLQVEAQQRLNAQARVRVVAAGVGSARRKLLVSNRAQQTVENGSESARDQAEIEIVPIDDFIDEAPTLIKIDIEGAEVDALIGAAETLRRHAPKLFIEVHTQLLGQFGYSLADLFAHIPSDLYDVNVIVEGVDAGWRKYEPGLENGVTTPMIVFATPRSAKIDAPMRRRRPASAAERIIIEREDEIRRLVDAVRDREGSILRLESIIRGREGEIASQADAIRNREAQIQTLVDVVGMREIEISKTAELVQIRETAITTLENNVRACHEEIERRGELLLLREQRIADLEIHEVEVVGRREAEIRDMLDIIRRRESNIIELENIIRRKNAEIQDAADILVQRESTIDRLEEVVRTREKEIESIGSIVRLREERIVTLERLLGNPESRAVDEEWRALSLEEKINRCLETIDGWCTPAKAAWLTRLIVSRSAAHIVEIGIFGGKSLIPMALAAQSVGPAAVIGVEPWAPDIAISEPTNEANDEWWKNVDFALVKERFFANAARYRVLPMIKVMEMDSESAFRFLEPGGRRFDLVHIDGAHSPQRALRDAKAWSSLVKKGGLVVFDDIGWPSVKLAREFLHGSLTVIEEVEETPSVSYGAYEVP